MTLDPTIRPTPTNSRPQVSGKSLRRAAKSPGVAHYLIHSYDFPPSPRRTACGQAHAAMPLCASPLHMPSHIFTRVGAWQTPSIRTAPRHARAGFLSRTPRAAVDEGCTPMTTYVWLHAARPRPRARALMDTSSPRETQRRPLRRRLRPRRDPRALHARSGGSGRMPRGWLVRGSPVDKFPQPSPSRGSPGLGPRAAATSPSQKDLERITACATR